MTVAGIGGVATHPDYQRRGLAGTLMQRAAEYMQDELRVPFGLLVCSDLRVDYYAKLGWQLLKAPVLFDRHGKKDTFEGNVMVLPLAGILWPEGTVDLCGTPW
jgi:GNAT superfamily N-acetyltransferase